MLLCYNILIENSGATMKSMTGYGKAVAYRDNKELTVELKSVNHRFLDISTKMPRAFLAYEDMIRSLLQQGLSRGHIDVFVNYRLVESSDKEVKVDLTLAEGYVDAVNALKNKFPNLRDDFTVSSLMRCGDVLNLEQVAEDDQVLKEMLAEAVSGAVAQLNVMRETEGNKLRNDLLGKLNVVEGLVSQVKIVAPTVAENYREKLRVRVQTALQDVVLDESKLANEVCFFADKCCIDEEITRLTAHIAHAREILSTEEPVGRKLDFLVQEFNRETNTICSKSVNVDLTNVALDLKNEIEKIREQIQNLE